MRQEEIEAARILQDEEHQVCFQLEGVTLDFDLRDLVKALFRLDEVEILTKEKAPELASVFAEGYYSLQKIINRSRLARDEIKEISECRWAKLLLDYAPGELTKRGMRMSKDAAEAVVRLHPEYQELMSAHRHLCWVVSDLEARKERLHKAHSTVLRVLGEYVPYRNPSFGSNEESGQNPKYGRTR